MKYTLCITRRCNLACAYCYVAKRPETMSLATARKVVDYIFRHAVGKERLEVGFFGGEPLLEFGLMQAITELIEGHPAYQKERVNLTVVTNGTLFSEAIARFLIEHNVRYCLSCDGPPHVQDAFRRSAEGEPSSARVEATLRAALPVFPEMVVNSVYRPETMESLPDTIDYLAGLGLRALYLNPDFSAPWTLADVAKLPHIYGRVAERYMALYLKGDPHFISLIDGKIAVVLRGGYHPLERCGMGVREMAFTPDGSIYPCERLIDGAASNGHCIGHVEQGVDMSRMACRQAPRHPLNPECLACSFKEYCMNWCGCSNHFMTGYYNRVGPFLCASEKAAIAVAVKVFCTLEERLGPTFIHHVSGKPHSNSAVTQT